jgi:hypothetical protein
MKKPSSTGCYTVSNSTSLLGPNAHHRDDPEVDKNRASASHSDGKPLYRPEGRKRSDPRTWMRRSACPMREEVFHCCSLGRKVPASWPSRLWVSKWRELCVPIVADDVLSVAPRDTHGGVFRSATARGQSQRLKAHRITGCEHPTPSFFIVKKWRIYLTNPRFWGKLDFRSPVTFAFWRLCTS